MAFGLPPKYEQQSELNGLNAQYYLTVALQAVNNLNWRVSYQGADGLIAYTKFSIHSYSDEFKVMISEDTVTISSRCTGTQMLDLGKNKRNVENFLAEFDKIFASLTDEELQAKADEFQAELAAKAASDSANAAVSQINPVKQKGGFLSVFIPAKGYFVTPIIVWLNILVFILMVCSGVSFLEPDTGSLIAWGANLRGLTLDGQAWRLFTNIFLHIGIMHLLLNMYALIYIGLLLEPYLGKTRFAAAYLLTGIAASIASICWNQNIVSAGASGAIFGMYGVFLAMLTTNFIEASARKALLTSIGIFVAYNLVNGLKAGIDGAAHVGGLVSGLVIGYAYYPSLKKPLVLKIKYVTVGIIALATLCSAAMVMHKIPNDFAVYDQKMKLFTYNETAALNILNTAASMSHEKALYEIKNHGINYWQESVKALQDADKLDIPEQLQSRDKLLIQYCQLRTTQFGLIYKSEDEHTEKYTSQLKECNEQIKDVMDQLKNLQ
jgi:rhomboid protease GluP